MKIGSASPSKASSAPPMPLHTEPNVSILFPEPCETYRQW
jgi:hypothetical protein